MQKNRSNKLNRSHIYGFHCSSAAAAPVKKIFYRSFFKCKRTGLINWIVVIFTVFTVVQLQLHLWKNCGMPQLNTFWSSLKKENIIERNQLNDPNPGPNV